jgi:ABC-type multidrug transport system fused ATPase/permease subunit
MKLLLMAAIRNSKHLTLAIVTIIFLLFLTVADQTERFSIGILANKGSDFFELFSSKEAKKKVDVTGITLQEVEKKWEKIDTEKKGVITKQDASLYLSRKQGKNPLTAIIHKISSEFDIEKNFVSLVMLLVCIALFKAVILFVSRFATQLLSIRVTRDLRMQYFKHIQSLPMSFYQEQNLGSLTARAVGDAGQIASSLNSCLTNYLQTPFTIITTLYYCFYLSWRLSMVIFLGLPLIILPVVFLTKKVKKIARQMQRNQESFTSVLLDFLSGIHTVKIFAMEAFTLRKFHQQNDRMAHLESKSAKYCLLTRPILHTVTTACLAFVILVGLYSLHMTIPQLLVFCGLLHLFYEPVKKFAEENANIQRGVIAAERMFEVLDLKPNIKDSDGAISLTTFKDKIEFENVSFKYKHDWVLKDVSFTVNKGETVAIVGPTGAGKSTIVHLLPRLFDVQKGSIRIDGKPLSDYTQQSLRENISFVPQKPFLFFDTVAENIMFGRKFSSDEVKIAAKKAHAHEFIINLPEQYDSILADTGKNLSGGQQQRLTIARALMKKAPILVMDEATSSLDSISENKIKLAINELRSEITQIIIAHRLSTVEHADKIIYIDGGRKLAEGTKEELLKTSPHFRHMWESYNLKKTVFT